MIIDLYVPICVFRVRYELASGRPFTDLEQVILKALAENRAGLSELAVRFCLRDAIVIESLVTLAREGWVALNAVDGTYFITSTGLQAIADAAIPQFLAVKEREMIVLMERVNGGLIGGSELRFLRANDPDFQGGNGPPVERRVEVESWNTRLAGGQIDSFLPKPKEQQWVCRVETPQLAGIDAHWAKATVDTKTGRVSFERSIPWEASLVDVLRRKATQVTGEEITVGADVVHPLLPASSWSEVRFEPSDIWLSREEHACALLNALEKAGSFVHVASAFFDPSALDGKIREALSAALERGVRIGLLWGYEQGERAKQAIDWLDKLAYEERQLRHTVWFNRTASDSHAKILAWDENGEQRVVVGSCNWLSCPSFVNDNTRTNISVCVRDPQVVSEVLRAFAGLWLQTGCQDWCPAADDLFNRAAKLSAQVAVADSRETIVPNGRLRMICDSDHESTMRDLLLNARSRCWIASHKMGFNASARLATLSHLDRPANLTARVTYEQMSHESTPVDNIEKLVRDAGGTLTQRNRFHAKCIVADDVAFVSSFNFLSASPFGSGRPAREVGLIVENKEIADLLWSQVENE